MKTSENIISGSQVHEPAMQWQADLMEHLREWDGKYGPTYLVPWQPWHVTPMTGDLGWTSWTCRFLWLPYKRCVYYCRLDQWCLILIPFSVMISSSQSSVKSFGIIPLNPIQKDASVTQFCIRSSSVEVLDLLQKARDSYRVERTTFTNNDKLHWCVHVQFCFFLIAMDPNGFQFNPRTFRIVVRFPFHVTGLLHQRRRARELRGVVRGRVCAEGRSASPTIFHKCPIFQKWGTKRKPKTWQGLVVNCPKLSNFREKSSANISSGPLSNWSDQGLWVSQS